MQIPVLSAILTTIKNFFDWFSQKYFLYGCMAASVFAIVCLIQHCITNPSGAINTFMKICIDIIVVPFPSTPDNMKFWSMVASIRSGASSSFPMFIALEILQGLAGMLSLVLFTKLFKFLPFF
jgi:hypothetical protein